MSESRENAPTAAVRLDQPQPASGLAALVQEHRADLLRFLTARSGSAADADDLLQELWLRASRVSSGPIANGRAYLYQTANNLVLDRVRERRRREQRDLSWHEHSYGALDSEAADPRADTATVLEEREEAAALASAIANLPDGARRAFHLHKLEGLSHAQVAARMGISRSGVEKHIALAMRHLRRALGN